MFREVDCLIHCIFPGTCTRGSERIVASKKVNSIERFLLQMCADGKSQCPRGNTCCKLATGEYGCCPLPKAVCCADHMHCCPNGYECGDGG